MCEIQLFIELSILVSKGFEHIFICENKTKTPFKSFTRSLGKKEKSKRHFTRRTYKSHAVRCATLHCSGTCARVRDKKIVLLRLCVLCELEFARVAIARRLPGQRRTHHSNEPTSLSGLHSHADDPCWHRITSGHAEIKTEKSMQICNRIDNIATSNLLTHRNTKWLGLHFSRCSNASKYEWKASHCDCGHKIQISIQRY